MVCLHSYVVNCNAKIYDVTYRVHTFLSLLYEPEYRTLTLYPVHTWIYLLPRKHISLVPTHQYHSFIHLFIYGFCKHELSVCYMSSAVQGAKVSSMTNIAPALKEATV